MLREPSISEHNTICHCHYATEVLRVLRKWHSQQNVILDAALSRTLCYMYVKMRGYELAKRIQAVAEGWIWGVSYTPIYALHSSITNICYNLSLRTNEKLYV